MPTRRIAVVEAIRRTPGQSVSANVPVYFARGAVRPDPAGRAFHALRSCAAENLSARRFAEYLSLSQVPDAKPDGSPPEAAPASERWVAPDQDLIPRAVANVLGNEPVPENASAESGNSDKDPVKRLDNYARRSRRPPGPPLSKLPSTAPSETSRHAGDGAVFHPPNPSQAVGNPKRSCIRENPRRRKCPISNTGESR
jgi:hypothetical protein